MSLSCDQWPGPLPGADYTPAPMKRIVILISGRGSNMEAIVKAAGK